ncbi:calponin homology domain-containing protein [Hyaloraphidium curvatum]|nr:calponin homology domain-containing protein [Hyaloraphidium curvatum]
MKDTSGYVYAGESRGELLAWLNGLLHLGVNRIEQCGSGAVYCQIMDSLYQDVPLKKVNFAAKSEYEYVANYKILQNAFDAHAVPNYIPVDRLIKCKFQDNMEFLQWLKKYWDAHYNGEHYDAVGRRGGAGPRLASPNPPKPALKTSASAALLPRTSRPQSSSSPRASAPALSKPDPLRAQLAAAERALAESEAALALATRERQFYFEKLREIEILVGDEGEPGPGCAMETGKLVDEIRGIMYKTEDGFAVPDEVEDGVAKLSVAEEVY